MTRAAESWPCPDEVATKSFTSSRRGFDPVEVRDYLARLAVVVSEAIERVTTLEDQLSILGEREQNETGQRAAVETLHAQVEDLTNRLTLATAMRGEALRRAADLEKALAAVDAPPVPAPQDELDRASSELAQILREARIRASHIRADAEQEARLIIEGAQRERRSAREERDRKDQQAAISLRERLAAICQDAENRVSAAHSEAARTLAEAEERAASTIEHANFQASRLVANAGDFTAMWLREAHQLRELGHLDPAPGSKSTEQTAAAEPSDDAAANSPHDNASQIEHTEPALQTQQAGQTEQLLDQADRLLSIAEVIRRAEPAAQTGQRNGSAASAEATQT